jgi:phosphatidylinositol dimannoside acyltransferase
VKEWVTSAAYRFGWTVVRRMPEGWVNWLFTRIADIVWRRQGKGVQQLEANLLRVVPDATGKQLRALSGSVMRSYLRYWKEAFRLQDIPAEALLSRTHSGGTEDHALELLAGGRGVIFALPHLGNYDEAGAWIIARGSGPFTTVAERLKPDSVFDQFVAYRERLGFEILPHTGASPFGVMAQRLRAGRLVCLVADRDLTASGVEVDLFGERARVAAGPAALAVQTGAALMPVTLWFEGEDWGLRVHPEVPVPADGIRQEKVAAMTQQVVAVWEAAIAEHPENWHMLQKVFVADLDPGRLPPSQAAAPGQAGPGQAGLGQAGGPGPETGAGRDAETPAL